LAGAELLGLPAQPGFQPGRFFLVNGPFLGGLIRDGIDLGQTFRGFFFIFGVNPLTKGFNLSPKGGFIPFIDGGATQTPAMLPNSGSVTNHTILLSSALY
jgi:hypothetical protein